MASIIEKNPNLIEKWQLNHDYKKIIEDGDLSPEDLAQLNEKYGTEVVDKYLAGRFDKLDRELTHYKPSLGLQVRNISGNYWEKHGQYRMAHGSLYSGLQALDEMNDIADAHAVSPQALSNANQTQPPTNPYTRKEGRVWENLSKEFDQDALLHKLKDTLLRLKVDPQSVNLERVMDALTPIDSSEYNDHKPLTADFLNEAFQSLEPADCEVLLHKLTQENQGARLTANEGVFSSSLLERLFPEKSTVSLKNPEQVVIDVLKLYEQRSSRNDLAGITTLEDIQKFPLGARILRTMRNDYPEALSQVVGHWPEDVKDCDSVYTMMKFIVNGLGWEMPEDSQAIYADFFNDIRTNLESYPEGSRGELQIFAIKGSYKLAETNSEKADILAEAREVSLGNDMALFLAEHDTQITPSLETYINNRLQDVATAYSERSDGGFNFSGDDVQKTRTLLETMQRNPALKEGVKPFVEQYNDALYDITDVVTKKLEASKKEKVDYREYLTSEAYKKACDKWEESKEVRVWNNILTMIQGDNSRNIDSLHLDESR